MRLERLVEMVRRTSDDVAHDRASGRNSGPEDLTVFLDNIKKSANVEEAKEVARRMTRFFAKGGVDAFLRALEKQRDLAGVMKLAYNAALKGEGLGVKK